jgi:hypothetical protein
VKVALGVGLGVGGAAVLIGFALYYKFRSTREEKRKRAIHEDTMPPEYKAVPTELPGPSIPEMYPTELDAPSTKLDAPSELP